ncbi:MAG: tetratricopeptide repeat protein [Moorea sp. SIO3G5]|nr:tetratricopeptide repeat protein [Moorena sp. SIO3G5]
MPPGFYDITPVKTLLELLIILGVALDVHTPPVFLQLDKAVAQDFPSIPKQDWRSGVRFRVRKTSIANQLFEQGIQQFRQGQFREAVATYQRVLAIRRQLNDKAGVAATLNNIGQVYIGLSDYPKALDTLQQALRIRQKLEDSTGQAETLNHIGFVYRRLGNYSQALGLHQQALEMATTIGNRDIIGESWHNIAAIYANQGDYDQALELYQQALGIRRETNNRFDEGRTLNNIGGVYYSIGEYSLARDFYQKALVIAREIGNRASVGRIYNNLGLIAGQTGDYTQALEYHQQALAILKELGDKDSVSYTLNNLGTVYENLGEYDQALTSYQQALTIATEINNPAREANALDTIGGVYYNRSRYYQALDYYQQALAIHKKIGNPASEAKTLINIGGVYEGLGQYSKALEFLEQALAIYREIDNKAGVGLTISSIGIIYERLNQYPQALASYQQALAIAQDINNPISESNTLNQIGGVYSSIGLYPKAINSYQQALAIAQEIGDIAGEGRILNSLAGTYVNTDQDSQAMGLLQEALVIFRDIGDLSAEGITLSNIGQVLEKQKQPELAIIFYKLSVNLTEQIRDELKPLPQEQQQSFTQTVANTYRHLADLLLQFDRVIEAQRVLDLLKIQELEDYLGNVQGNEQTLEGIGLLSLEQRISNRIKSVLKRTESQDSSPSFDQFISSPDVVKLVQQLRRQAREQRLDVSYLDILQNSLRQLEQNAVLLYPLILEDRLELVLVTPDSFPIHHSVTINHEQLKDAIAKFRRAITDRIRVNQARAEAQKLYNLLIKPIEDNLTTAQAQTILYAPDGILRYVPLAALHDGEQWLVERYSINTITAASFINLNNHLPRQPRVLSAAFTSGECEFQLGKRPFNFSGLRFAGVEVETIAALIPETTKLFQQDFKPSTIVEQINNRNNNYNIVHLATHAAFLPGQPEDSFILFGNCELATLRDLETWNLNGVNLVVLSACETGVGGVLGNGEEILGFGYQMQRLGALATIASLWSVDDQGTQVLMDAFYQTMLKGNITIAEALRQAQIGLINSHYNSPYYWAPFILIGNGF